MKKKLLFFVLFLILFATYNVKALECVEYQNGDGTEENPYQITNNMELYSINCNLDKNFILMNNLNLTHDTSDEDGLFYNEGNGWISIGNGDYSTNKFSGSLNGNGKAIIGLTQKRTLNDATTDPKLRIGGLFMYVTGEVKNLNMKDIDIEIVEEKSFGVTIGGITAFVGELYGNSKIVNCNISSGTIKYTQTYEINQSYVPYEIGGIAGTTSNGNVLIENCNNFVNIIADTPTSDYVDGNIAGIIGSSFSVGDEKIVIKNCMNAGRIKGRENAAGIIDSISSQSTTYSEIVGCLNDNTIEADYVGGIVSSMAGNVNLSNSSNLGTINAKSIGGGIAGLVIYSGDDTRGLIDKCYNSGTINTFDSAGGIAGITVFPISNSFNYGKINVDEYNDWNRIPDKNVGGIVGRTSGDLSVITNTYNVGLINSTASDVNIGNIVGNANSDIINSYYYSNEYSGVGVLNDPYVSGSGEDQSTALSSEQLFNMDSYRGFDFVEIWNMNQNNSYMLPQLNNLEIRDVDIVKSVTIQSQSSVPVFSQLCVNTTITPNNIGGDEVKIEVKNGTGAAEIDSTYPECFNPTNVGTITVVASSKSRPYIYAEKQITITPIEFNYRNCGADTDAIYYDGQYHGLKINCESDKVKVKFSPDGYNDYTSDESPKYKDVGRYYIKYLLYVDDPNYSNMQAGSADLEIRSAYLSDLTQNKTVTYDGKEYTIDLEYKRIFDGELYDVDPTDVIIKYADSSGAYTLNEIPKYTEAGTYTIKYSIIGNYEKPHDPSSLTISSIPYEALSGSAKLIINKATLIDNSKDLTLVFDGNEHQIAINTNAVNPTIKYADSSGNYNLDNAPKYKNVGNYTIKYKITSNNYNDYTGEKTLSIHGIQSFESTLKVKDSFLIVRDYINVIKTLQERIKFLATSHVWKHLDSSKKEISDETFKTGNYIRLNIDNAKDFDYQLVILGDANGDGEISALDYVKIKNHIMGDKVITEPIYLISADINEDDEISALDYVRIKNYIMNGGA